MDTKATATLLDGSKIKGRLTTNHAASSYNKPVFVDTDNQAINWADIKDISTPASLGKMGGSITSERKTASSRENGKSGGHPVSFKTAIKRLATNPTKNRERLVDVINAAVEPLCKTNTYNDEGSDAHTHLQDWIAEGDFTGDETPNSIASEWDNLVDDMG